MLEQKWRGQIYMQNDELNLFMCFSDTHVKPIYGHMLC